VVAGEDLEPIILQQVLEETEDLVADLEVVFQDLLVLLELEIHQLNLRHKVIMVLKVFLAGTELPEAAVALLKQEI
jgi:hypothetical protein